MRHVRPGRATAARTPGTGVGGASAASDDVPVITAFWSALDILRPLVLAYVVWQYVQRVDEVAYPMRGFAVLGVLAFWTLLSIWLRRRTRVWLGTELVLGAAAVLASSLADSRAAIEAGAPTIPGMWPAATVLSWAVLGGPVAGAGAAGVLAVADVVLIGTPSSVTVHNIVILLLLGTLIGYCADLVREGHRIAREADAVRARAEERERLARNVHDGVLQALSLVHRRGLEIGGEATELGRLAAEQERRLRDLIRVPVITADRSVASASGSAGPERVDLAALLTARADERVAVVDTGEAVVLSAHRAREIDAAVGAALDNVRAHAGPDARAWVLLERIDDEVVVTVRDNGCGVPPGRLDEARAQGRLGVSSSIVGRLTDLGGRAEIATTPGGTRVELRAPVQGADEEA